MQLTQTELVELDPYNIIGVSIMLKLATGLMELGPTELVVTLLMYPEQLPVILRDGHVMLTFITFIMMPAILATLVMYLIIYEHSTETNR